jgi:hypothetical protein
VASVPALRSNRRQIFGDEAHFQLGDLEFLINGLRDLPSLNKDKLAVVGFGFGGLSAAMLAMNNTDVDALSSVWIASSGARSAFRIFKSNLYRPNSLSASTLHITTAQTGRFTDMAFLIPPKYSDQYHLKINGLRPVDFSSLAMLTPLVPGFGGPAQGEIKIENAQPGYETVCRYVAHFF